MVESNSHWGLFHYKRPRNSKRTVATLIQKFDNAPEARALMQQWRAKGPVYVGMVSKDATVTPQGKGMFTKHTKLLAPCGKLDRTDVEHGFNQADFQHAE